MEPQRRTAMAPADTARARLGRTGAPGSLGAGTAGQPGATQPGSPASAGSQELAHLATPASAGGAPERLIHVETPLYRATFSTRGARLTSIALKHYAMAHDLTGKGHVHPSRAGEYPEDAWVTLGGGPTFGVDLGSGDGLVSLAAADYAESESLDAAGQIRALTFTLRDSSGLVVRQTYRLRPGDYALDLAVEMTGVRADAKLTDYSLTARSWPLVTEATLPTDLR